MLFNTIEFIYFFLPFALVLHFLLARWSIAAAAAWSDAVRRWREPQRVSVPAVASALQGGAAADTPGPSPEFHVPDPVDVPRQLAMFERFVALCRDHDIRLIVAVSPIRRPTGPFPDLGELDRFIAQVARITPVWDFSRGLLPTREFWHDSVHYKAIVGVLMLNRILGRSIDAPAEFGQLHGAAIAP